MWGAGPHTGPTAAPAALPAGCQRACRPCSNPVDEAGPGGWPRSAPQGFRGPWRLLLTGQQERAVFRPEWVL